MTTLTDQNAQVGMIIENKRNPEWGTFRITDIDLFEGCKLISAGQKFINDPSEWIIKK